MDTQKHISSAFDQDLTILNDALQQLGDLACQQLEGAIEGLAMQNQVNLDTVSYTHLTLPTSDLV